MTGKLLCILLLLGGCCTEPAIVKLPCPPRPVLQSITQEEQLSISPEVLEKIAANQIALKSYAKKLEARACE